MGTMESCTCEVCVAACLRKPGWFLPGEAERVADYLGISLEELFATRLGTDYWVGHDDQPDTFVLAPAVVEMEPGGRYPHHPLGRCVFLTENHRCAIHAVKPFECRAMLHGEGTTVHSTIAANWKAQEHQVAILKLEISASDRRRGRRK